MGSRRQPQAGALAGSLFGFGWHSQQGADDFARETSSDTGRSRRNTGLRARQLLGNHLLLTVQSLAMTVIGKQP
jgi:hypothetical protein